MALIICPHCGKQVSDTTEQCIHCGQLIKEKPPEPKTYDDFSAWEREAFISEFESKYPNYNFRKLQTRNKILINVLVIILLLLFVFMVASAFLAFNSQNQYDEYYETHGIRTSRPLGEYEYKNYWIEYTDTGVILWTQEENDELHRLSSKGPITAVIGVGASFLIGIIALIAIGICHMKVTKKYLLHYKLYTKWLSEEKSILYRPALSPRQKDEFDNLNIDQYHFRKGECQYGMNVPNAEKKFPIKAFAVYIAVRRSLSAPSAER